MPTIEIVSINSSRIGLNQSDYEIAIIEENKLKGHRGLFDKLLKKQNGVIVHLGNPDFKNNKENGFFAGDLIDWEFENVDVIIPEFSENDDELNMGANQHFKFKLLKEFKIEIDKILNLALKNSPASKIYFLTDYQFGPEEGKVEIIYNIENFWKLHDKDCLSFNTLYEMYSE